MGKNYYSTSSRTYDYKSRENGIDSLPDIRSRNTQSLGRCVRVCVCVMVRLGSYYGTVRCKQWCRDLEFSRTKRV